MKLRWIVGVPSLAVTLALLAGSQQVTKSSAPGHLPGSLAVDGPPILPEYAGDPNPHEPGELEFAMPERSGGCESGKWARSRFDRWVNGVYAFSGEVYRVEVDLRVRGRKQDFVWARKYRSQLGVDTPQGYGWDHSYNIWIEADGPDLVLHDGFGRAEPYVLQVDGSWQDGDTFDPVTLNLDGTYTLTFPNRGQWNFAPLDGAVTAGRIQSIVDRNGNAMGFAYDGLGRLATITDDLNRNYTVDYRPDGRIGSVTDFTGRQVAYDYYPNGDPDGAPGDLRSVRSPVVVNTPNGNDFPAGKTTVYTYTSGFPDDFLNHNLLTVTDPKGQTYLQYDYAPTLDRTDPWFDRAVGQVWGDPGDRVDLHYEPVVPGPSNGQAVIVTVVNDRRGIVKEVYSDANNRIVMIRELTGFANPDQPTTLAANRPAGKLRATDPDTFETRWVYNDDGLITSILHPELNEDQFVYDEANPSRRSQGNLRERRELPGPRGGDQAMIEEFFEYATDLGGCCGTNFVMRHVDPRGNETLHAYDANGNRTQTTHRISSIVEDWEWSGFGQMTAHVHPDNGSGARRRDEFTYHASGPNTGYLASKVEDVDNFAHTTLYEYSPRGRLTRRTFPSGDDELYARNQLDQVVQYRSRAVMTPAGPVRHGRDFFYDANDQYFRIETLNIDEGGNPRANATLTTTYQYDVLNEKTGMSREIDSSEDATTQYVLDPNRNVALVRRPEAVNGSDADNVVQHLHDERDLLYREVRAPGTSEQSTTQHDYDGNRNRALTAGGIERTPHVATRTFDGYDRVLVETDPMGNESASSYDANGNRVTRQVSGELVDVPGSTGNQLLQAVDTTFDAMDRKTREDRAFFDTITGTPIDDGLATASWTYSDSSQALSATNDNGHTTFVTYDTRLRVKTRTDAVGNVVEYGYDANDNLIQLLETDRSTSGASDQVFQTTMAYDERDRPVATTDNVGNMWVERYDSRDNRTRTIDSLGNEVLYDHDGLDREIRVERVLTDTGDGSGTQVGSIVTQTEWDANSRVVARVDDNGNRTEYGFDALDRQIFELFADGTSQTCTYDVHGNEVSCTDPNGTVTAKQYDLADRHIRTDVQILGAGVAPNPNYLDYQYDGLGRVVAASDDDSIVNREYDSLSQVTREVLNGKSVTCTFDGVGNRISCQLPGARHIARTFDSGERLESIVDAAAPAVDLARFEYVGQRVESTAYANDLLLEYTYDGITGVPNPPGDFGVRRLSRMLHTNTSNMDVVEDRRFAWDRMMNSTVRRDARLGGPRLRRELSYDSAYRLVESDLIDPTPQSVQNVTYALDGAHNRSLVTGDLTPGTYTQDPTLRDPADAQVNQYTTTSFDARTYDLNGNLTSTGPRTGGTSRTFEYDFLNQLVRVDNLVTGEEHHYAHDAFGRRIAKVEDALGVSGAPVETRFYYCGDEACEEQDAGGATLATYVLGRAIDRPVQMQRGGLDFYYHADDLGNVWSISDATGSVVERYEYTDYGLPLDPTNLIPLNFPPPSGNAYAFQGRRYDPLVSAYWFRTRYMSPATGDFMQRDTKGLWYDSVTVGNARNFSGSTPWTASDPRGTSVIHAAAFVAASVGFVASVIAVYQFASDLRSSAVRQCEKDASAALDQCNAGGEDPACCAELYEKHIAGECSGPLALYGIDDFRAACQGRREYEESLVEEDPVPGNLQESLDNIEALRKQGRAADPSGTVSWSVAGDDDVCMVYCDEDGTIIRYTGPCTSADLALGCSGNVIAD